MSAEVSSVRMMFGEMSFGKLSRLDLCGCHLAMVWAMGESDSGGLVVGPASVRIADVQFRDSGLLGCPCILNNH